MSTSSYNKRYVFAAACLGMLLFGIVMISLGSILPEVNEKFQLNEVETGYLATLLPLGILAGSLLFGPLVDWLYYKKILLAGTVFTAIGILGIVLAETLTLLSGSVFCIGLGGGILNGVTNALVSEISEEHASADLSLLGVFFGLGALGTPVILGLFKGIYAFEEILTGLLALITVFAMVFLRINFPKSNNEQGIALKDGLKMLRDPFLLLLGFILFFQSGLEGLTNNWTTSYLESVKEVSAANALFALSGFVAALTIARLALGKLLRIYQPHSVMTVSCLLALGGYFLLYRGDSYYSLFTALIIVGFGLAAAFPVILGFVGQRYTTHSGTAFSMVITIALIGNVLANYTMGLVGEKIGLITLPYFLISGVTAILVLLLVLKKRYKS